MAGPLGCPAGTNNGASLDTGEATVEEACDKLVQCGILAESYLGEHGQSGTCPDKPCNAKPGGRCIAVQSGFQCFYLYLDRYWCVLQLTALRSQNPCSMSPAPAAFTTEDVAMAVSCIMATSCPALGMPFDEKIKSAEHRGEMDLFICKTTTSSNPKRWTATICDNGLLSYQ